MQERALYNYKSMTKQERATEIFRRLRNLYPDAGTELANWNGEPWKFLFCVILSAQTTDVNVNNATGGLFEKFPTLESFANAKSEEIEKKISTISFFRSKAKYLQKSARMILDDFGGVLPDDLEEIIKLPGAARKTANVVTGDVFDKPQGIAVDTHVILLSNRFKLTRHKDPVKIEKDLMKLFPQKDWAKVSISIILHGRRVCKARKPTCADCPLNDICPSAFKV